MTDLYTEQMDESALHVRHTVLQKLEGQGYRPEYVDHRIAPSSDGDKCYLVSRVRCLDVPFGPDVDVADAQTEVFICGCDHFAYRLAAEVVDGDKPPSAIQKCKHCIASYRAEQAKADDNQQSL